MTLAIFIVQGDKGVKGKTGLEGVKVKKSKEEKNIAPVRHYVTALADESVRLCRGSVASLETQDRR